MKKRIIAIMCMLMIACTFTGCFGGSDSGDVVTGQKPPQKSEDDFEDPAYLNEQDGAEIISVARPEDEFVGKWAALSEYAEHLYGNVNLVINSDHTWSGVITDDKYTGKWFVETPGINIKDDEGYINWKLFFVSDGNLVFQSSKDPDITIVLKRTGN